MFKKDVFYKAIAGFCIGHGLTGLYLHPNLSVGMVAFAGFVIFYQSYCCENKNDE